MSEREVKFQCKKCGLCCTNMRGKLFGMVCGLMLMPSEVGLFPKEPVKPMFRNKPSHPFKPGFVWMYQLDAMVCPHYKSGNCKIYGRHPLICRAFPFEFSRQGEKKVRVVVHAKCSEVVKLDTMDASVTIPNSFAEAAWKVHTYYERNLTSIQIERFDLDRGWIEITDGLTEEDIKIIKGRN